MKCRAFELNSVLNNKWAKGPIKIRHFVGSIHCILGPSMVRGFFSTVVDIYTSILSAGWCLDNTRAQPNYTYEEQYTYSSDSSNASERTRENIQFENRSTESNWAPQPSPAVLASPENNGAKERESLRPQSIHWSDVWTKKKNYYRPIILHNYRVKIINKSNYNNKLKNNIFSRALLSTLYMMAWVG